nr:MAG TPA: hypothetical protein [Caudoviricetes sp.]
MFILNFNGINSPPFTSLVYRKHCTKTSAKVAKEKTKVRAKRQYTCTNISAIIFL